MKVSLQDTLFNNPNHEATTEESAFDFEAAEIIEYSEESGDKKYLIDFPAFRKIVKNTPSPIGGIQQYDMQEVRKEREKICGICI